MSSAYSRREIQVLMRGNSILHRVLGIDESDLPIFNQDWWIHIARGSSEYHEPKVFNGDVVVGRLPYIVSRNLIGLAQAHDPHWSHLGGPVVDENLSRKEQAEVLHQLMERLPRYCSFCFVCDPNTNYADLVRGAFMNAGFQHTTQLTYVRRPGNTGVMDTRKGKHNGHIRRASKNLDCVEICAEEFVSFFGANLKARGMKSYSPLDILKRLIEEGSSRGRLRAIAARQRYPEEVTGNYGVAKPYDAAIVYVWDDRYCYYWLSTHRIPSAFSLYEKPHPDAIKFLAMKAMEDAQAKNLVFDADGITTPGTMNLYRNMFGLRKAAARDVFTRPTAAERLFQKYRPGIKKSAALFGIR